MLPTVCETCEIAYKPRFDIVTMWTQAPCINLLIQRSLLRLIFFCKWCANYGNAKLLNMKFLWTKDEFSLNGKAHQKFADSCQNTYEHANGKVCTSDDYNLIIGSSFSRLKLKCRKNQRNSQPYSFNSKKGSRKKPYFSYFCVGAMFKRHKMRLWLKLK